MKAKIVLLLVVCLSCAAVVFAQNDPNHGLLLRGRMYEGEQEEYKDYVVWKAKLAMELVNTGSEPVIIIHPAKELPQWQSDVKFWGMYKFSFSKNINRPQGSAEELKILAEFLAGDEPPPNQFVVIQPNETLAFEDNFEVKQKFTEEKVIYNGKEYGRGKRWEGTVGELGKYEDAGTYPISSLRSLQIKYEFSLLKYQINANLLEILQERWRSVGILPVDANGGFSITSQTIDSNINYKKIKKSV